MMDWDLIHQAIEFAARNPSDDPKHPAIQAGLAPGGMVFHLYVDGAFVSEERVHTPDEGTVAGEASVPILEAASRRRVSHEVRVYDGDTGAWVMTRQVFPR